MRTSYCCHVLQWRPFVPLVLVHQEVSVNVVHECMPRLNLFTGEVESIHVLAEFVEEDGSTAVVPLQRVLNLEDLESVQAGEKITVLWYDGKKYPAVFLTSGQYLELLSTLHGRIKAKLVLVFLAPHYIPYASWLVEQ